MISSSFSLALLDMPKVLIRNMLQSGFTFLGGH